jgi:hypothetical protein
MTSPFVSKLGGLRSPLFKVVSLPPYMAGKGKAAYDGLQRCRHAAIVADHSLGTGRVSRRGGALFRFDDSTC